MRRSGLAIFALVAFLAAGMAGSTYAGGTTPPACTTGAAGTLAPVLQDFSVNQGLQSYTSTAAGFTGRLVRGKETLVRPYFTLPSTCSGTITLSSATLNATIGGFAKSYTPLAGTGSGSVPAAIATSATVDPLFVVPAADLAPGNGSSTFTAAWSLSLTFTQNKVATSITKAYNATPIPSATTFEKKTNALRILVVPMGDASRTFSSQFPSLAQTDVQNAMSTLSRIYPVESGIGDLGSSTGGIRYTINLAAMVDLKSIPNAYNLTTGHFCGSQTNFDAIKAQLAQFLQTWNTQNPNATADRVIGAVYGGNNTVATPGISDGGSSGCAEGMAGINSQVAWVRAIDENTVARPPMHSWTGAVMAMEIAHTFGLVPSPRASLTSAYHSANIVADTVTPTGRAYNVTSRTYVASNHSVMRYDTSTSPFDNTDTLLEQQDYNDLLCLLTPGGLTNSECAITGVAGSVVGAAGSMLVGSGTTDGTAPNTNVVETYFSTGAAPSGTCDGSPLEVVQLIGSGVVAHTPVCLETLTSDHDSDSGAPSIHNTIGVFSFAVPSAGGDSVRLTYNGAIIYQRTRQATQPIVTSVAATQDFGPLTFNAPVIPPTPDILILADTTGSMGPALTSVKDALTHVGDGIIPTVSASRSNAEFGAASYKDVSSDPPGYWLNQPITTTSDNVQTAVNAWLPGGGGDTPEDQLNALYQIATNNPAVGWRDGSTRIVVWFGDSNGHDPSPNSDGHSLASVEAALVSANIHVVAVPVSGSGNGLETLVNDHNQPAEIVSATGGKLQPLTDASSVASAILAGLQDLPVTLGQSTSCNDERITLTLGTRTPSEDPLASGGAVTYSDVVAHIAPDTTPGDYTCTVSFTVNGNPDRALTKTFNVHVAPTSSDVTVTATSPTPDNLRVDVVYVCGLVQYPVAVGLTPAQVNGQVASFSTHFDSTLACGDAGGQLVAYATDGVDRAGSSPTTPEAGPPSLKPPTAAIYAPFGDAYAPGSTVAFSGTGISPQTGELHGTALRWTLNGTSITIDPGNTGSLQLPITPGTYTLTLTASDSVGSGTDSHVLTVVQPPSLTITHTPTGASTTANPVAVTVSASDNPSGLASVACSIDGAPVTVPTPPSAAGASYSAPLSVSDYGLHTVQCVATANDGLTTSRDDQVRIAYFFNGFLAPVNNGVTNTGKAGRTYPIKWQLQDAAGHFFSSLAIVTSIQLRGVNCVSLSPSVDPLEIAATGGTVLRYDSGANQYIYNWQSPSSAGCYELDVSTDDGTVHTAYFKLS